MTDEEEKIDGYEELTITDWKIDLDGVDNKECEFLCFERGSEQKQELPTAIALNDIEEVKRLILAGFDINSKNTVQVYNPDNSHIGYPARSYEITPVMQAKKYGHKDIEELLKQHGAKQ